MKTLGEKVKELRIDKDMTQGELAKELGYTNKTTITKIETDVNKLSYEMTKKIAEYFGVNIAYLFDDDNSFPYSIYTTDTNGKGRTYRLTDKQYEEIISKLDAMEEENI